MSPFQLFLYLLAAGFGLFVCSLLAMLVWFFWCALKGYLSEEPEPR